MALEELRDELRSDILKHIKALETRIEVRFGAIDQRFEKL